MRGEQSIMCCKSSVRAGSPPLARGTGLCKYGRLERGGITPACAGNSCSHSSTGGVAGDHPRLRGEQLGKGGRPYQARGSPPLARGTGAIVPCAAVPRRITPACAGNSTPPYTGIRPLWDHPRLRGEQLTPKVKGYKSNGSPPLARGTGAIVPCAAVPRRITPACAGNRASVTCWSRPAGDHPRLRGEQGLKGW